MSKALTTLTLLCASLSAQVAASYGTPIDDGDQILGGSPAQSVYPVVEWNRTLLTIVRTAGAQPATVHSTRSFAILHAAIYDAVNNIEGTFSPYLVRLPDVSRKASQSATADQAAHDVLLALYPAFRQRSTPSLGRTWRKFPMES
jgi:hypothetical protein